MSNQCQIGFKTTRTVVWCVDHTALCGQHLSTHTQGLKITPQPQFPTKNLTDNTTLKKSWGCAVRTTTLKPSVVLIPIHCIIIEAKRISDIKIVMGQVQSINPMKYFAFIFQEEKEKNSLAMNYSENLMITSMKKTQRLISKDI